MKRSDAIDQISAAVIAARSQMRSLRKNAKGAYAEYADLPEVLDVITGPLKEANLAIIQSPSMDAETGYCTLTTLLVHAESGQWLEGSLAMKPELDKGHQGACQAVGSCISYARRYSLAALFSLAQADNDAEGATDAAVLPPSDRARAGNARQATRATGTQRDAESGQWGVVNDDGITIIEVKDDSYTRDGEQKERWSVKTSLCEQAGRQYGITTFKREVADIAKEALSTNAPVRVEISTRPKRDGGKFYDLDEIEILPPSAAPAVSAIEFS